MSSTPQQRQSRSPQRASPQPSSTTLPFTNAVPWAIQKQFNTSIVEPGNSKPEREGVKLHDINLPQVRHADRLLERRPAPQRESSGTVYPSQDRRRSGSRSPSVGFGDFGAWPNSSSGPLPPTARSPQSRTNHSPQRTPSLHRVEQDKTQMHEARGHHEIVIDHGKTVHKEINRTEMAIEKEAALAKIRDDHGIVFGGGKAVCKRDFCIKANNNHPLAFDEVTMVVMDNTLSSVQAHIKNVDKCEKKNEKKNETEAALANLRESNEIVVENGKAVCKKPTCVGTHRVGLPNNLSSVNKHIGTARHQRTA
ncbi:MAG: hypothetical protein CYPHOPRED_003972 [Cyphobasidiales sp. Tagirdzhanova-0007]|nr:MAG: hypothetical protein CYPHOPRED_003972 [Cyphobasidiales sp. Tagirdzhanova-0007]